MKRKVLLICSILLVFIWINSCRDLLENATYCDPEVRLLTCDSPQKCHRGDDYWLQEKGVKLIDCDDASCDNKIAAAGLLCVL